MQEARPLLRARSMQHRPVRGAGAVFLVILLAIAAAQPAVADVPNATYNSSPLIGTAVDRAHACRYLAQCCCYIQAAAAVVLDILFRARRSSCCLFYSRLCCCMARYVLRPGNVIKSHL